MTRLSEALALQREVEATIKADIDKRTAIQKHAEPLGVERNRVYARHQRQPIVIARPADKFMLTTLAGPHLSYVEYADNLEAVAKARSRKAQRAACVELLRNGSLKIALPNEGTAMSAKGLAQRTRVPTAEAEKAIALARKRKAAAYAAYVKADRALAEAERASYEQGHKPELEGFLDALAERFAPDVLLAIDKKATANLLSEWRVEAMRNNANEHVKAAREKRDCECDDCRSQRNKAEWAKRNALALKEKAREEAQYEKVSFTCPRCGCDSVSTVVNGTVKCGGGWECRTPIKVEALRTKRVPKSTPVGQIAHAA